MLLLGAGLALFWVFLPAFVTDFAIHNDYRIWEYENRSIGLGFGESSHLFYVGRPLGAALLNLQLSFFTDIRSLRAGRFLAFALLLVTLGVFALVLTRRFHLSPLLSVAIGLSVGLLPAATSYVVWVTNLVPGVLTMLLSCIAYSLVAPSMTSGAAIRNAGHAWVGYLLLFLCMYIYQPAALFFFVFPLVAALNVSDAHWPLLRDGLFRQTLIGCGLIAAHVVFTPLIVTPALLSFLPSMRHYSLFNRCYEPTLGLDVSTKLEVLREFLSTTLNLWVPNDVPGFFIIVLVVTCLAFAIRLGALVEAGTARSRRDGTERLMLAAVAVAISTSPVLIPPGGFVAYRIIVATSAMAAAVFVWAVQSCLRSVASKATTVVVATTLGLLAFWCGGATVRLVVANTSGELDFVRRSLSALDLSKTREIAVLCPEWGDRIAARPLSHDLRCLATNFAFVEGLFQGVIEERGTARGRITITPIPGSARGVGREVLRSSIPLIDMNEAGFQGTYPRFGPADGPQQPQEWERSPYGPWWLARDHGGYHLVLFKSRVYAFPLGYRPDYSDPGLGYRPGVLSADRASSIIAKIDTERARRTRPTTAPEERR